MIQVAQLLLSLSILVLIHELGHFAFAKLFKTRVEKFYLFFNPWFSIFKIKKGETEYGLGWLPLGGYVKIAGMIDESMDKKQMEAPPQPWEFRSKPAWQRLFIMIGGVLFNFILAFLLYIAILGIWGEKYIPIAEINNHGVMVDSLGTKLGFQNGDKIISVNDKEQTNLVDAYKELIISEPHNVKIIRNGKDSLITITNEQISLVLKNGSPFFGPRVPFVIELFAENSIAQKSGMLKGDKIISIDSIKTEYYDEFRKEIVKHKNEQVNIGVLRNNSDTVYISLNVPEDGILGIQAMDTLSKFYSIEVKKYTFLQAIPAGINKTIVEVRDYLKQIKLVFTPKTDAYKSVGSFISLGKMFPKKWDWEHFWHMTALLSIMLGVVNLLPIPALDGGHVMFTIYEIIFRRKPSEKFMEKAQIVGMIILLALIVFALGNDIIRNFFN